MTNERTPDSFDPSKDPLWEELRAIESEAGPGPNGEHLEQLAAGTINPADEARLRAAAADDPELALLVEVHEPLSSEWKASTVDRIAARDAASDVGPETRTPARKPIESSPSLADRLKSPFTFLAPGPWVWGTGLAAAALCFVVVFGLRGSDAIPNYEIEVSGGVSEMRSPTVARRLTPDSSFEFVLRPERELNGLVRSRLYLETPEGLKAIPLPSETSASGAIRFRGHVERDLGLGAGDYKLVFVVASEGGLPTDEVVASALTSEAAREPPREDIRIITQSLIIEGDP